MSSIIHRLLLSGLLLVLISCRLGARLCPPRHSRVRRIPYGRGTKRRAVSGQCAVVGTLS